MSENENATQSATQPKTTLKPTDVPAGTVVVAESARPTVDNYGHDQLACRLSGDFQGRVAYLSMDSGPAKGLASGKLVMPLRLTPTTLYLAPRTSKDGKALKAGTYVMWGLAPKAKA